VGYSDREGGAGSHGGEWGGGGVPTKGWDRPPGYTGRDRDSEVLGGGGVPTGFNPVMSSYVSGGGGYVSFSP